MEFEKVRDIIVETLGCDAEEVTPEASLSDDLGADSLAAVELVMALEEATGLSIAEEDAGLHFLLRVRTDAASEEIVRQAQQNGVRVTSLSDYYREAPPQAASAFVISYSEIPDSKIPEAVARLTRAVLAAIKK